MKVRQLIKILMDYNMDAEVTTSCSETVEVSYVWMNGQYDESNTPIVFIDGCDLEETSAP